MAQGEFTRQEADATEEAVVELFNALPKTKQYNFLGHYNDILLFISAAKKHAPDEDAAAAPDEAKAADEA